MKLFIFLLLITGCVMACSGTDSKPDRAVGKDFQRYLAQLDLITTLEVEANGANEKAVTAPNANDATYAVVLRETIILKLEEFERELRRIHPATNEILGLHKQLVKRAASQVAGFRELEGSTRGGGDAAIQRGNEYFAEGRTLYKLWSGRMNELARRYPKTP